MTIPAELYPTLDHIIRQRSPQLTGEQRVQAINQLYTELEQHLTDVAIDALPDNQLDSFGQLLDQQANPEKMRDFLAKSVPNMKTLMSAATQEFLQRQVKLP